MKLLEKTGNGLAKVLFWTAGTAIVLMMLLTCADVVLRFGVTVYRVSGWHFLESVRPIPGTYELVKFLGAVAVSFAMAHTSVNKGHVAVSLVVRLLPTKLQGLIGSITGTFSFALFLLIAWQATVYANDLMASGEVSLTLQLPFYPFVYGVGFSAFAVSIVLFSDIIKNLTKLFGR